MVNFEEKTLKKMAPGLIGTSKQWMLESIQNVASTLKFGENSSRLLGSFGNNSNNLANDDNDEEREEEEVEQQQQQQAASTEYLVYNWFESLFAWFQVIILWHEPYMSLCAISGLSISFLSLTYFAPRFYATIMIVLFIYNLNKFWFRYVWPDIRVPPGVEREIELRLDVDRFTYLHPQIMTLAELGEHLNNLIELGELYLFKLLRLRHKRPVAFCALICTILSFTAYVGNSISGFSLIFCSMAIIMIAPGIYYHLLSKSSRDKLREVFSNIIIIEKIQNNNEIAAAAAAAESYRNQEGEEGLNHQSQSPSLASTIASTTKSQALSLYAHFKRKSFSFSGSRGQLSGDSSIEQRQQRDEEEKEEGEGGEEVIRSSKLVHSNNNSTLVPSPTIDVPRNNNNNNHAHSDINNQQQSNETTQNKSDWRQRLQQQNDDDENNDLEEEQDSQSNSSGSKCESRRGNNFARRGNFSSNSSVSLIDSDSEEQQDGFVLL